LFHLAYTCFLFLSLFFLSFLSFSATMDGEARDLARAERKSIRLFENRAVVRAVVESPKQKLRHGKQSEKKRDEERVQ